MLARDDGEVVGQSSDEFFKPKPRDGDAGIKLCEPFVIVYNRGVARPVEVTRRAASKFGREDLLPLGVQNNGQPAYVNGSLRGDDLQRIDANDRRTHGV